MDRGAANITENHRLGRESLSSVQRALKMQHRPVGRHGLWQSRPAKESLEALRWRQLLA